MFENSCVGLLLTVSFGLRKTNREGKREGYENSNVLYEVYVTNLAEVSKESELITADIVKCMRGRKYESDKN